MTRAELKTKCQALALAGDAQAQATLTAIAHLECFEGTTHPELLKANHQPTENLSQPPAPPASPPLVSPPRQP